MFTTIINKIWHISKSSFVPICGQYPLIPAALGTANLITVPLILPFPAH